MRARSADLPLLLRPEDEGGPYHHVDVSSLPLPSSPSPLSPSPSSLSLLLHFLYTDEVPSALSLAEQRELLLLATALGVPALCARLSGGGGSGAGEPVVAASGSSADRIVG